MGGNYIRIIASLVLTVTLIPLAASISLTDGPSASVKNSDSLAGVYDSKGAFLYATGQIQTAVDKARSGATIFLWPKIYYDNVKVDKSIKIIGFSPYLTIVDGSKGTDPNLGSVFVIGRNEKGEYVPGVTATLSGLTIRRGTGADLGPYGGGIYNDHSTLTVKNCIIKDNTAYAGGGIFNNGYEGTATLTLMNSKIFGNTAQDSGGGIYNDAIEGTATLSLDCSQIYGNTAAGWGGGIYNDGRSYGTATLTLMNSRIFKNTVGAGGGIYNYGVDDGTATVNLRSGSIDHNTADPTTSSGGGIYSVDGTINGNRNIVHDNTPDNIVEIKF